MAAVNIIKDRATRPKNYRPYSPTRVLVREYVFERGMTKNAAAEQIGVSRERVRTHVKAILEREPDLRYRDGVGGYKETAS